MPGLPESFDVTKRLGLFVYLAEKAERPINLKSLFSIYCSDFTYLSESIKRYRNYCTNQDAQNKLRTGLVTPKGLTSFVKYLRIGHSLGIFDFSLDQNEVSPTWTAHVIREMPGNSYAPHFDFELTRAMKLLFACIMIKKDSDLLTPLATALRIVKPRCGEVDTKQLRLEYSRSLESLFLKTLERGALSPVDLTTYVRRYEFFQRNVRLLEEGIEPTRRLKHMIDSRVNWLLDLILVDQCELCYNGLIIPTDFWRILETQAKLDDLSQSDVLDQFFEAYKKHLDSQETPFEDRNIRDERGNFIRLMSVKETIDMVLRSLGKVYRELVMIEAILLMTWAICNGYGTRYVGSKEILTTIENEYVTYRRKMTGLGFVQVPQ